MEDIKIEKAIAFSTRIEDLHKKLLAAREQVVSKQIYRSGTSIGANISETVFAESKADRLHKIRIALKEANETKYWLNILHNTKYLTDDEFNSLLNDCHELIYILAAIVRTLSSKSDNK